ncbi:hypothetical protein NL676_004006 [Syzygium grande]|nr:hypothetical protein NL676_004006 [Syzygium grande]
MGRKGAWFSAVKKALSPESREKKDKKSRKSKKKWFGKSSTLDPVSSAEETVLAVPAPPPPVEELKLKPRQRLLLLRLLLRSFANDCFTILGQIERGNCSYQDSNCIPRILGEEGIASFTGLVRLKTLIQGQSVKRQATTTLRCMQTLARLQSQIRARRIRMSEENQALQRQLQQKCEKELEKLRLGDEWNDSVQSKEQIEANLLSKQEAAMRRERALAYAFSHQQTWKNNSKSANPTFMDPHNPHWGWSWLERWMAARPWETRSTVEYNDQGSVRSTTSHAMSLGEISRAYSRRNLDNDNKASPTAHQPSRAPSRHSPSTPPSKALSVSSVTSKTKPPSPKGRGWGGPAGDDDSRSMFSVQSEQYRRHTIAGSSARDDESLASTTSVPSYMAPTQSAKAKSRLSSPLGLDKSGTPEKGSVGSVKKRLSFPSSPAGPRRHLGPPRVESSSIKELGA